MKISGIANLEQGERARCRSTRITRRLLAIGKSGVRKDDPIRFEDKDYIFVKTTAKATLVIQSVTDGRKISVSAVDCSLRGRRICNLDLY